MLDVYAVVKTVHILSAAILFGTGAGIAYFFLRGQRDPDWVAKAFAARATVRADFIFTLPAVIIQPLTGAWLIWRGGIDWRDFWLVATYALYALAGACWLPVVAIQMRLARISAERANGQYIDEARYAQLFRWWFALGWPAFGGLVVVFFLMVAKPGW